MSFPTSIYSLGNIMDEVDIEDLTIEEYLKLTQENHAPRIGDWFEAELEKCWKIQQKKDSSHLNLRRQARDDALRNWEAQIDQLRRQNMKEVSLGIKEDRDGLSHEADSKTYWCEPVRQEHEKGYTFTNDDDRISLEWEGLSCTNWVRARYGVSKDKDDLEGIIDYLEPTLYDGFIDHNDEVAYKRRRNKLLGMPYTEPPPIIKEEAEITKYNLGASENPELRGNYQTGPTHDSHVGNIMDEVDIEDLTIEQYFRMTQESQKPKKVDDMTIAEYLGDEEAMKTQDYNEYQPNSTKADVLTIYKDHLSPHHKSPVSPLDTKTNPYHQASQSPVHPKITKTTTKYTREIEEQSNQGLVDIFSINAIADLGASINIMSKSMLDELSLSDPKHPNIIVEMADKTRKVSLRIKEDRVKIKMKEQECNTAIDEHLNTRPTSQAGLSHGAVNKTHWETKERAIIRAMINKLPEEWFSKVSRDKDDLEGIIDYLEPILYDGFIDYNDEAYKQRRNKLLGMPYS
ncbi:hypothetical protein Tco_1068467 [Tanacetum coccineum]|uniref:Uncharacterized protein n=1 Tax=Tanacetum coccineum TaxID=301880 RepID=A0ABQ5HFT0_9ASTR